MIKVAEAWRASWRTHVERFAVKGPDRTVLLRKAKKTETCEDGDGKGPRRKS